MTKHRNLKLYSLSLLVALLFSLNIHAFLRSYLNTFDSEYWEIAKDKLSHAVMGAYSFKYLHYITGGSLQLNRFYGFNEIDFKKTENKSLRFTGLSFDLNLGQKSSYLYIIFKKNPDGCYAFRLSGSEEKDNCFIRYSNLMEKERETAIEYPPLAENRRYRIKVNLLPQSFELYIDGELVATIEDSVFSRGRIGFRCGYEKVLIDNIEILGIYHDENAEKSLGPEYRFYENFEGPGNSFAWFVLSFLLSVLFHSVLFSIIFYLLKTSFGLDKGEIGRTSFSLLKPLLFLSSGMLVLQLLRPEMRFNRFSLFYFGRIWLPSLRFLYIYTFGFIVLFLYRVRNVSAHSVTKNTTPSRAVVFIISLLVLFCFLQNGNCLDIVSVANPAPQMQKIEPPEKNIVLDSPVRIDGLPENYTFCCSFNLKRESARFLIIVEGNEFVVGPGKKTYPGFETVGAHKDFLYGYTNPKTKTALENDKSYDLRIVKEICSLTAYIDDRFIDKRSYNRSSVSENLDNTIYLFPVSGSPEIQSLTIKPTAGKKYRLDVSKIKTNLRPTLILFVLFALNLCICLLASERKSILTTADGFMRHVRLLALLLPFFILYRFFDHLLFNDKLFYLILYYAYISTVIFILYKTGNTKLIAFVALLILVLFVIILRRARNMPMDLQPTIFSYFKLKKGFDKFKKPPQGVKAFLYNNKFDSAYKESLKGKKTILLLGSSQTWGSGAAAKNLKISDYLETYLKDAGYNRIKVVNCGINGANSLYLGNFFDNFLVRFEPELIILNLSNNDYFFWMFSYYKNSEEQEVLDNNIKDSFKSTIKEKFIARCENMGIKILLVKEPNSPENKDKINNLAKLHIALEELSTGHHIPIVSPQTVLDEYGRDNPIWWDFMHLSSLGQRIFAKEIAEAVIKNNLLEK